MEIIIEDNGAIELGPTCAGQLPICKPRTRGMALSHVQYARTSHLIVTQPVPRRHPTHTVRARFCFAKLRAMACRCTIEAGIVALNFQQSTEAESAGYLE
jgi:hypothetical protein